MSEIEQDPPAPPAIQPGSPKDKALQAAGKAFMALPPPAQKVTIQVAMKVGPVVAKAGPYKKKILVGGVALLAVRKVRRRGR